MSPCYRVLARPDEGFIGIDQFPMGIPGTVVDSVVYLIRETRRCWVDGDNCRKVEDSLAVVVYTSTTRERTGGTQL